MQDLDAASHDRRGRRRECLRQARIPFADDRILPACQTPKSKQNNRYGSDLIRSAQIESNLGRTSASLERLLQIRLEDERVPYPQPPCDDLTDAMWDADDQRVTHAEGALDVGHTGIRPALREPL